MPYVDKKSPMFNKGLFLSGDGEWSTPDDLFAELNSEFRFTLDAAATAENAKCERFFSKEDDGLSQSWASERVWLNPPYGRSIGRWIEKAYTEARDHNAEVVLLLPARTDTAWFHDYIINAATIYFLRGRLKFGGSTNSAPFPSMLVFFGWHISNLATDYNAASRELTKLREENKRLRVASEKAKQGALI